MFRFLRIVMVALVLAPPGVAAQEARQSKLAVIPTQFDESARGLVPNLFDDYVLTAVQNRGGCEVIGPEDISAMISFDEHKELLDCSDTSCMATLGGALGVDRIVVMKIARLGEDWVVTAKIINIRETRVENRINEIMQGNVKRLMKSVPDFVARLFGDAPSAPPAPSAPQQPTGIERPPGPPPPGSAPTAA